MLIELEDRSDGVDIYFVLKLFLLLRRSTFGTLFCQRHTYGATLHHSIISLQLDKYDSCFCTVDEYLISG